MIYDLNNYRHTMIPVISNWIAANPEKAIVDEIPKIALSTNCPLVVICYLVTEILPGSIPRLDDYRDSLIKYYHVDGVVGQIKSSEEAS